MADRHLVRYLSGVYAVDGVARLVGFAVKNKIGLRMDYFRDLIIAGRCALRFRRHWYLGRQCYALMLSEAEFVVLQRAMDDILKELDEHRRDN